MYTSLANVKKRPKQELHLTVKSLTHAVSDALRLCHPLPTMNVPGWLNASALTREL